MRSDHRYLVREAIRREQGEPVREPVRREARDYDRYEEEPPPREREYERREYRDPPPQYREPPPQYREPGPIYSAPAPAPAREPDPAYSDHEAEVPYSARRERQPYSVRGPEPYVRREPRATYSQQEAGGYSQRPSMVRRSMRDRPQHREDSRSEAETEDADSSDEPTAPAWFAVTRATAFFVGCVTLLNLLAEMRFANFSAAAWWINLEPVPKSASRGLLALSAVLFVAFALFPRANAFVRRLGAMCTLALLGAVGWTIYRYYHAHAGQSPQSLPVPFALHVAALLIVVLPGQLTGWWEQTNFFKDFFVGSVTLVTCIATFPLAHFACAGQLDEPGALDAAVVFAGQSDAEKSADDKAARNPLRTALQLYRDGQIKKILLIGRPSESGHSEETVQILRRAALAEGIAEADLLTPPSKDNPSDFRASLAEAAKFLDDQKFSHVLIVARFFEVPRIKLSFQRAGLDAHAAPVRDELRTAQIRPLLVRESVALWACYLQPLTM